MAPPDINSLSSRPSPTMERTHTPPSSMSLAAAASLNNAERSPNARGSPRLRERMPSDRRRSQVLMNLSLNDPALPSPGEMADRHHRQPSLGDIHNELEQEQEFQTNRLLGMIRTQQAQLDALRAQAGEGTAVVEDLTPQSEPSTALPIRPRQSSRSARASGQEHASPQLPHWPPSPADSASPAIGVRRNSSSRRSSIRDRDETAYYQAETANLQRENQMLRMRIRELEKQLSEQQGDGTSSVVRSSLSLTSTEVEETS